MKLHTMGTGYRHDRDFHILRPHGSGDNLLVIFRTPAFVITDGVRREVPPDTAVLYAKAAPQDYGAAGADYINDWVHFECDENDIFFERLNIPFNRPVPVSSAAGTKTALEQLKIESVSDTRKSRECADLLLRLLIAQAAGSEPPSSPRSEALKHLRAEIHNSPSESYTVSGAAARLSLSPTYFQTLYRREFGVSFYEDVLRAKTKLAQYYLANTEMTVQEISGLCGFQNDVHFMRQFHKRTGQTALEYRKAVSRG